MLHGDSVHFFTIEFPCHHSRIGGGEPWALHDKFAGDFSKISMLVFLNEMLGAQGSKEKCNFFYFTKRHVLAYA